MPIKVWVLVEMYQGLINEVKVFGNEKRSELAFFMATGVSWKEYQRRIKDENYENILASYAGTMIYVTPIE